MKDIITALKDTPVPSILIIAGIVFLILALAGKLAGQIEVPPARQKLTGVIGVVLLVIGLVLYVVPPKSVSPSPVANTTTNSPTSNSIQAPTSPAPTPTNVSLSTSTPPTTIPPSMTPVASNASEPTLSPTTFTAVTALIASDSFTRADSSTIGSGWTQQKGTFEIVSNQLHLKTFVPGDIGLDVATWDTTLSPSGADYDVEADVKLGTTGGVDVIARWQDMNNMYVAELNTVDQGVHLWKVVSGQVTQLGGTGVVGGYSINNTYKLRLSAIGSTISVYVDGVKKIEVTDTSISNAGKPGVGADSVDKTWDNFDVYSR